MSRKGENIYKRKDGRWEGRYPKGYRPDGKIAYSSVYARSYREVKEKMKQKNLQNTEKIKRSSMFSCYADNWLENVRISKKISTYNKYKSIYFLHIKPFIGNLCTELINSENIGALLDGCKDLSPKTQNDIICVLKMIFGHAAENGAKCGLSLKSLKVRQEYKQMRVLSTDEQNIFSAFLLSDINLIKAGVYLSLCTGIRIGELCALKKEDICFEDKMLYINKTMQRVEVENSISLTKVIISEPKSARSIRTIPLPDFLIKICGEIYRDLAPEDHLLTGSKKYMEPRALQYHFKKYLNECGIKNATFHTLRHTFATRCVENGFEIKTLSEILGHVNVNITLNRYVHSSVELKRINMEKLNNIFQPS